MSASWHIGDLHFGHEKVAQIRGYDSVDQHDRAIYDQWNRQVRPNDIVTVYGDISSGRCEEHALEIIASLPGIKHLIAGNHDSVSSIHRNGRSRQKRFLEVFDSVSDFGRIRMCGRQVLMCHYPYASQGDGPERGPARYLQYRLPDLGGLLIHAHTHHNHPTSGSLTGRELCVSWDAWHRLVGQGDIDKWIQSIAPADVESHDDHSLARRA